jgi:hypothetical protein
MTQAATESLSAVQERALGALRRDGIAVLRFGELFDEVLWAEAQRDIAPFVAASEEAAKAMGDRPSGKEEVIFRRFFDKASTEEPELSIDSPWLRIAASDQLLGIVNAYRETTTRLFYVDNWYTPAYPGAQERVASQRWHRDPEHEHVVKLFVYLSDVDEGAGPFEYVRSSTGGGRYGQLWRWGGSSDDWYPPTEELEAAVAEEDRLVLSGSAGTVVLCDTGGFHRGGFARARPRVLAVATYLQPGLKGKFGRSRFAVDFGGREHELSRPVRAALV